MRCQTSLLFSNGMGVDSVDHEVGERVPKLHMRAKSQRANCRIRDAPKVKGSFKLVYDDD
jgi:hypothetical protein